jgi:hypothetical protein
MFASVKQSVDPRPAIQAISAALILAAVVAAGAVIALPKTTVEPAAPAAEFVAPARDDWFAPVSGPATQSRDDWFVPAAGGTTSSGAGQFGGWGGPRQR